jgi:hypothetical protein
MVPLFMAALPPWDFSDGAIPNEFLADTGLLCFVRIDAPFRIYPERGFHLSLNCHP